MNELQPRIAARAPAQAYHGDRTKADLLTFADTLAGSAGQPHYYIRRAPRWRSKLYPYPSALHHTPLMPLLLSGAARCPAA